MLTDERLGVRVGDVAAVADALGALVGALDPDAVFVFDAPKLWAAFDGVERLAASAKTLLARRVEEASTWQSAGFRSAAEQLASVAGTSVGSARAMLETSKNVMDLPATADALRSGALSPAKAQVIVSAATVAPGAEARLLDAAASKPLGALRQECLRERAGVDRDAAHARIHRERRFREWVDDEGAWNFAGRGTPELASAFRTAHGPIVDELFTAARKEGRREPYEAYAFDAFIELARRASDGSAADASGKDTSDAPVKPKRPSPKYLGLIRVDHEALRRGEVEGDEVCEIAGLGPIPVRVARELLGDAVLKMVITKGVDVANVTHLGRSPTAAQRVALKWLAPMCTRDICTRTWRLENDHRLGWAETLRTCLGELDPLCEHEHDLKTYFGWSLVAGTGRRAFVAPDDPRHPRNHPPPDP